jgi:hypothetical protein
MKVLKDLGLIFGWNFFPPADMLEVARLFWFGTFHAVEAKEGTILLGEVSGEQVCDRHALLATKQTNFHKISFASTGLELLPPLYAQCLICKNEVYREMSSRSRSTKIDHDQLE